MSRLLFTSTLPLCLGFAYVIFYVKPRADTDWLSIIMRVTHVSAVTMLSGGTAFIYLMLRRAAGRKVLHVSKKHDDDKVVDEFKKQPWFQDWLFVSAQFKFLIMGSGIYFAVRDWAQFKGDKVFHSLFGMKMLAALALFFFSAALTGRARCLQFVRDNRHRYYKLNTFLALTCIALAGAIKAHRAGL